MLFGLYREKAEEEFTLAAVDLASAENIVMKIGDLGMLTFGFDSHRQPTPPDSSDLQRKWGRVIDTAIELFGPDRCMFESNFPVDKQSCTYVLLWNAYKKHTSSYSPAEHAALFSGTCICLTTDRRDGAGDLGRCDRAGQVVALYTP